MIISENKALIFFLGTNDIVGGAGDNGMMFGYALNETKKYLPKAMVILQELSKKYYECTPKRIIGDLNLKNTDYIKTSMFGHFGIDQICEN